MTPTSLYIHIPWCIRKCPYCDFNSHKSPDILPEMAYVQALLADLRQDLTEFPKRPIQSIFFGGGTPSLFSAEAYAQLLAELRLLLPFTEDIEITLEANPGTIEQQRFQDYRQLGINRLSLGIQSFQADHLNRLGRIHDDKQAHQAIETARLAGFDNLNLDIMHSLPDQTLNQGMADLTTALSYHPEHLSWYQLTLEPNTVFYKKRPELPNEEQTDILETQGMALLASQGFTRYEISAFCQDDKQARHNMNYWLFGDYYGIGAGAHGKLSLNPGQIMRTRKQRQPKDYLNPAKAYCVETLSLKHEDLVFEFMLNTTRLEQPIPVTLFSERTSLVYEEHLLPKLEEAAMQGLIILQPDAWQVSPTGRRFTNDLQALFLHPSTRT